ncbi:MAG TPA: magnesium-translocating P-type ATPase [Patescibacteria group bacterium]|nr:magnesium-translocating P-type ATPase [Patescibacteria group bacterium]
MNQEFYKLTYEDTLTKLQSRLSGLSETEVLERQKKYGLNTIHKRHVSLFTISLRQFTNNPLIIILAAATLISYFLGQQISAYYIFGMILVSIILGVWNEFSAEKTVDNLLKKISPTCFVLRNDEHTEIPVSHLTIGDIVLLSQGSIIPAELRLLETKNLEINQSALTGESKTVFKTDTPLSTTSTINQMTNIAFMGTAVENGSGKGVVIRIGKDTEFGKIAKSTMFIKPQTDFEKGLSNFGTLLVKVILILSLGIFVINALLGRQLLESLLFALAIAVGLTPELLPVIVTVSLSHGAGKLAKKKVIAKQLIAIENLGNMDVLCTDKTGTLTEGSIELVDYFDREHKKSLPVLLASLHCNDAIVHRHILGNSIDAAIWKYAQKNNVHLPANISKIDDDPFDYNKKAMFAVVEEANNCTLIVKGAPDTILKLCHKTEENKSLHEKFVALNNDGLRLVAVATKKVNKKEEYSWKDANELTFLGYLTFLDVPKLSAKEALAKLRGLNVEVKVITGDNEIVTQKVCKEVGMTVEGILVGEQIEKMSDSVLSEHLDKTNVFARLSPEQKMRIIKAFRAKGHTVGYLGDGINDIPSLRASDVGISVNTAIDVAKDVAAIVLLHKSLDVIADGIMEGRRTFNNTIKYILMGTSSNFGNMFSAAGASFFLPFLPMTPVQILLTNGLYDLSQLSIPSDNVDAESLVKPRHWNINFIRNYMIFFGPISSIYDFLTFGVMIYFFHAQGALFQTGWFIESMATEILVVFVIRTSKTPFFFSKPGKWLLITCLTIVAASLLIPISPLAKPLGFVSPPPLYFVILVLLVSTYLGLVGILKQQFLKRYTL